ncbi:MAG TPA: ATP-dependent Clp protease proteolytic subunit [Tepidisphaeraceae bacterium]
MKNALWVLIVSLLLTNSAFSQSTRPFEPRGPAAVVELTGEINDYSADVFEKHVKAARDAGARTILLRLDTPGGVVGSALRMSQFIKRQRPEIQFVAVVHDMALSAGAMLAVACDRIVMEPGALLGDCAPILMGPSGLQTLTGAERAKMESPILAEFYDSAHRSGYDQLMVSAMVQYGVVVHYLQGPDGQRRFVTAADQATLTKEGWTPVADVPTPLDGPEQLLTVTDSLAARIGLSAGTVASPEAYAQANGLTVVGTFRTTLGEELVGLLSGAGLRSLLGIVFMWSLYTAISKPGTGVPETIALVSGAVLLGVPLLTGYAGWLEFLLILSGVVLIAFELFVIPGFGVAGLAGIILMIVGLVLTYAPPELPGGGLVPQLQGTWTALRHGMVGVTAALVVSALLWVWLAKYLPRIPYMNRLILATTVGSTPEEGDIRHAVEEAWPRTGDSGQAITRLTPGGVANFFDPIINDARPVDVVSDHGYVDVGARVVVRSREGATIVVRAVGERAVSSS